MKKLILLMAAMAFMLPNPRPAKADPGVAILGAIIIGGAIAAHNSRRRHRHYNGYYYGPPMYYYKPRKYRPYRARRHRGYHRRRYYRRHYHRGHRRHRRSDMEMGARRVSPVSNPVRSNPVSIPQPRRESAPVVNRGRNPSGTSAAPDPYAPRVR